MRRRRPTRDGRPEWPLAHAVARRPADPTVHPSPLPCDVDAVTGLAGAEEVMAAAIAAEARRRIGGDVRRLDRVDTRYRDVACRSVLLPAWIRTYLHNGRSWQVLVNGATGGVRGARPYSAPKIVAAVAAGIALVGAVVALIVLTR